MKEITQHERNMWNRMNVGLMLAIGPKHLRMQRIEDAYSSGIPDVAFSASWKRKRIAGWIELKRVLKYPVRKATPIKMEHFTKEQKLFLKLHGRLSHSAYLFVQVENDYYIFDHINIDKLGDEYDRADFERLCCGMWRGGCNWKEVYMVLVGMRLN